MTDTTARPFKLDGVSLQTFRWNLVDMSGMFGRPGKRGDILLTPYNDGGFTEPEKFYNPRRMVARMMIMGTDANGGTAHPDGWFGQLYQNVDDLMDLLNSKTLHVLERTLADGTTKRELDVEVIDAIPIRSLYADRGYALGVQFIAARPLWREMPLITDTENGISSFPHAFTIDVGGNAPVQDIKITIACTAAGINPSLKEDVSGDIVTVVDSLVNTDSVVIDLANRSFKKNGTTTNTITRNRGWYLRLAPDQSSLGMTFDATSGTYNLMIERYDKWF